MGSFVVREWRGSMSLTPGLRVHSGRYRHEGAMFAHSHGFIELVVVAAGSGVHCSAAGRRTVSVGDVVLLRPGLWHSYEECDGLELLNCCFSPGLLQGELSWMREDPMLGRLLWTGCGQSDGRLEGEALDECVSHLDALGGLDAQSRRADAVGRLTLVLGLAARALVGRSADGPGVHPGVNAAARMLEERFDESWTLKDLGAELHLSPGYLARIFKAAMGLPPMGYLARHRIETAAGLLLGTDLPVGRIARQVGMADQNLFARRFREHAGMSPTEYRKRFAGHDRDEDNAMR
ncbi:helix-turn-helix transcriptional regulator [Glycomyces terrestris]|uniref:AraC family transcriptional regulator n=1 Tax=Glycomyces terrestris TaxID=2493553 RepID=A0A426UTB2_9ACTN|nr:AraC family transcriptional regulator [Glycomyces terrestris]RRR96775.1 AraC family transcriptional regulator [Glycomyces terrestris]